MTVTHEASEARTWRIWSNAHGAWWRPNRSGYTLEKREAGLYTKREADSICRDGGVPRAWSTGGGPFETAFFAYDLHGLPGRFQDRVAPWMMACFGPVVSADREERNHRFLEEAIELVQACGCTAGEAHSLVDYVYVRAVGAPPQEVGGVMVTLAALCLANGLDMHEAAEIELVRISDSATMEKIRAKQAAKPKHSPLPGATPEPMAAAPEAACDGCGSTQTIEEIRARGNLSCCPERKMLSAAEWQERAEKAESDLRFRGADVIDLRAANAKLREALKAMRTRYRNALVTAGAGEEAARRAASQWDDLLDAATDVRPRPAGAPEGGL